MLVEWGKGENVNKEERVRVKRKLIFKKEIKERQNV